MKSAGNSVNSKRSPGQGVLSCNDSVLPGSEAFITMVYSTKAKHPSTDCRPPSHRAPRFRPSLPLKGCLGGLELIHELLGVPRPISGTKASPVWGCPFGRARSPTLRCGPSPPWCWLIRSSNGSGGVRRCDFGSAYLF